MKNKHTGKYIAPIVITVLNVLAMVGLICLYIWVPIFVAVKIVLSIAYLACISLCVYVLIERIKEIRSGEEDDLSKY